MKLVLAQVSCNEKDPLSIEYIIEEGPVGVELKYSFSGNWNESIVNTVAASIMDDGSGVQIRIGKKKINLDYSELSQLFILLSYRNKEKYEIHEAKLIKSITP
jgi:hypothetical protein